MSRDDFFDNLFNDGAPAAEDLKRIRQLAYEERVIKRVFTECGAAPHSWGKLAVACRRATDSTKLHFNWFNSAYHFPGKLCGRRIPYIHKITLPELFKPTNKNRLVKAVGKQLAECELNPAKDPYVFVFPLIKTAFCAHSLVRAGAEPLYDDTRIQVEFRAPDGRRPLFIEPLKQLCRAIGNEWTLE